MSLIEIKTNWHSKEEGWASLHSTKSFVMGCPQRIALSQDFLLHNQHFIDLAIFEKGVKENNIKALYMVL